MRLLSALLVSLLLVSPASANYLSAKTLLAMFESSNEKVVASAIGYIIGQHDATYGVVHCIKKGYDAEDLVNMVKISMTMHVQAKPETADKEAAWHIQQILSAVAPCKRT